MKIGALSRQEVRGQLRGAGLAFKIGRFDVSFHTTVSSVGEDIYRLYADYELSSPGELVDFHVALKPSPGLRRWIKPQVQFFLDAHCPFRPLPRRQGFAMFEWSLNWCIASTSHNFLIIHAAVVERDGKAVILPGTPGSGKSTLCAALVNRGWRLLSDEMALLSIADGMIHPVPRPISLKNESIDIVRELSSDVYIGRVVRDTTKGTVAHMRAPAASVTSGRVTAEPALLFFPKFSMGAGVRVSKISRGLALMRVAQNSFNYHVLGKDGFDAASDLVERCECYESEYQYLHEVIAAIEDLL